MRNFIFISPHFPDSYWKFCMALKEHGFNVLGIGDAPYNEIPEQCKYALTEYYLCSFMDEFENEKRAVQYFRDKYGSIEFIESNNEYWLRKDARLRDIFQVNTSFSEEEVAYRMKKSNQKEFYEKAGVRCARYIVSKDLDEIKEFAQKVNYPIFAKPNVGVGAQGTKKIDNEIELEDFVLSIPKDSEYIFEEFVNGDLCSFDGITNSNGDVVFETSHMFYVNTADVVNKNLDDMYCCLPHVPEDLKEIGEKCVKSFGLKRRFFHFEFFRLKEDHPYLGKKGTIVPLEANLRVAGGYTPDLINFANSIDVYNLYADIMAYDENRQKMDYEKFYAVSCSRRYEYNYVHSKDEILTKYHNNVCYFGDFPRALRDDMGDSFFVGKFKSIEEVFEFDKFVREKVER